MPVALNRAVFQPQPRGDSNTPNDLRAPAAGYDVMLYGLGWSRTVFHGHVVYSHIGATGAFGTFVFWLPDLRYAIAIFGNTAGTLNSVKTLLSWRLIEDRLEVPKDRRVDVSGQSARTSGTQSSALLTCYTRRDSCLDSRQPKTLPISPARTWTQATEPCSSRRQQTDPEDAASTVLVGSNRSGIIIGFDVLLRHVSGGYWVLYLSSAEVPLEMGAALAAELKFGNDANASALKIIWDQAKPGPREVKDLFNKVE
ncbi:Beta-lactamase/transpeptidase-like protein, partial [Metarhizium majus ARSEF 297]